MKKELILKIPDIILKELNQDADLDEIELLNEWLSQSDRNQQLFDQIRQKKNLYALIKEHDKINSAQAWDKLNNKIRKKERGIRWVLLSSLKYAAILLVPIIIAAYLLYQRGTSIESDLSLGNLEEQIDKLEESSLIMADGTIINLSDKSPENSIVEIDGTRIVKAESAISYSSNSRDANREIQYNSLVTPKSKVFNVILSDGTKVWLNASSAIQYPTQFSSDSRRVYLTGEAYFEVSRDIGKPFIVSTNHMEVEVLGTSFNLMAYPNDNSVETTLVEGEVHVKTSDFKIVLEPGKQVKFDRSSNTIEEREVNTDLYTSWKSGKYIFDYENLENVMTKLSRWYDLEIIYAEYDKNELHFSGTLYKYNDIRQTLHIIELATNVKFDISDETITVSRN